MMFARKPILMLSGIAAALLAGVGAIVLWERSRPFAADVVISPTEVRAWAEDEWNAAFHPAAVPPGSPGYREMIAPDESGAFTLPDGRAGKVLAIAVAVPVGGAESAPYQYFSPDLAPLSPAQLGAMGIEPGTAKTYGWPMLGVALKIAVNEDPDEIAIARPLVFDAQTHVRLSRREALPESGALGDAFAPSAIKCWHAPALRLLVPIYTGKPEAYSVTFTEPLPSGVMAIKGHKIAHEKSDFEVQIIREYPFHLARDQSITEVTMQYLHSTEGVMLTEVTASFTDGTESIADWKSMFGDHSEPRFARLLGRISGQFRDRHIDEIRSLKVRVLRDWSSASLSLSLPQLPIAGLATSPTNLLDVAFPAEPINGATAPLLRAIDVSQLQLISGPTTFYQEGPDDGSTPRDVFKWADEAGLQEDRRVEIDGETHEIGFPHRAKPLWRRFLDSLKFD